MPLPEYSFLIGIVYLMMRYVIRQLAKLSIMYFNSNRLVEERHMLRLFLNYTRNDCSMEAVRDHFSVSRLRLFTV